MIVADSSVWIDHFRTGKNRLAEALSRQEICIHPLVIGELATGSLPDRRRTLADLRMLPVAAIAGFDECLHFIEQHRLHGRGLGWTDVQLLASAGLEGIPLWTRDKVLSAAATKLGLAHPG